MTDSSARDQDVGEAEALSPIARPEFRAAFDAHVSYVAHLLRRLGVRAAELDDATQETFLVVHRRFSEYDPSRPLRPWIAGIGYRVALEHRRRSARRSETALDDAPVTPDPAPRAEERMQQQEDRNLLLAALDSLDLERRAVIVMHEIDGTDMPEIAQALGIPVNTGYSRLRIGRQELAAAVKRLRLRRGER